MLRHEVFREEKEQGTVATEVGLGNKRSRKAVSRETALEIAAICGRHFLKLRHLHYGYWTDGLEVDIANLRRAQENYVEFLISHIPESVETILDVGCGTGQIARELLGTGFEVDCVSPCSYLGKRARELLEGKGDIFECRYEDLRTESSGVLDYEDATGMWERF
ncbi:MAG: methyltransferase domain-containing protein [Planctomycetota bacterium]